MPEPSLPEVLAMLEERGVHDAASVLRDWDHDAGYDGVVGAIRWYDDRQRGPVGGRPNTGLLVTVIREGGKPGYKGFSPGRGERPTSPPPAVTEKLLNAVRGQCLTPDGMTRDEVLATFEDAARVRGLTADELVSQAMGRDWIETPSHPGRLYTPDGRMYERYQRWVYEGGETRPDQTVVRADGESELDWSSRFWNFKDAEEEEADEADAEVSW